MDTNTRYNRIEEIARDAGEEHSLHMGEAIGSAVATAWNALERAGGWLLRRIMKPAPARSLRTSIW